MALRITVYDYLKEKFGENPFAWGPISGMVGQLTTQSLFLKSL